MLTRRLLGRASAARRHVTGSCFAPGWPKGSSAPCATEFRGIQRLPRPRGNRQRLLLRRRRDSAARRGPRPDAPEPDRLPLGAVEWVHEWPMPGELRPPRQARERSCTQTQPCSRTEAYDIRWQLARRPRERWPWQPHSKAASERGVAAVRRDRRLTEGASTTGPRRQGAGTPVV